MGEWVVVALLVDTEAEESPFQEVVEKGSFLGGEGGREGGREGG